MSRILVVEDDFSVWTGLEFLLKRGGYEAVLAKNVLHALEMLERFKYDYDLAIVDLLMPDETGKEDYEAGIKVLKHMEERCPTLPAIILTAFTDYKEARIACEQLSNCRAYIGKEPDPAKLMEEIDKVLSGKRVEAH